jgi:uncharacterized protein YggE
MRHFIRLAPTLLAAAALACAACSEKQKEPLRTRLLVTGESDSKVPPDTAVIVLSVVTQSTRALDAQQQNARKSDAVIQAVKQTTGATPDVQTSDYSLEPQRDWSAGLPRIKGYEARNSVTVTMSDLQKVGAVIDAASQAGANNVETVSFILRQDQLARGQALAGATREAISKANTIAQALGGRLSRILEVQEDGARPRPVENTYARDAMVAQAASTPIEVGTLEVTSRVQLIAEIETAQ